MSAECGWDRDGYYEARDLRVDVDALRRTVEDLLRANADLQQQVRVLRARINSREMSAA